MRLSDQNRTTLLIDLHRVIEEAAEEFSAKLLSGHADQLISYLPNGGLTDAEHRALNGLEDNEIARNALRKVFACNAARVIFDLLNVLDGTGDPDPDLGAWSGVVISDLPDDFDENQEFLHDAFYETYSKWGEFRKADYSLDSCADV